MRKEGTTFDGIFQYTLGALVCHRLSVNGFNSIPSVPEEMHKVWDNLFGDDIFHPLVFD